ncbi:hypothetical protein ACOSP7_019805 [Xanthoceras sorbifolium]|uniref:VQ domain-containing protein n=1 Tax=Xanthoceras sorbifolium TaxID=99658 RepID=A0ABQ8I3D1_9ROSI|nr:hypothetical protein JRO89_XS05G0261900 [Xanthoceras sorbifolium]
MSPAKLHDHDHQPRRSSDQINGLRPSPLKLNRDSHTIHKPSSSSLAQQPRNGPIIIYTHSPKVIHTQARDFMALVQKLTGLSSRNSDHNHDHAPSQPLPPPQEAKTTSRGGEGGVGVVGNSLTLVSPVMKPPANPFLADIPLFTPNSTEHFFYSPRAMFRFSETTTSPTTNVAGTCNNPISPSLLEFMKGLPEY